MTMLFKLSIIHHSWLHSPRLFHLHPLILTMPLAIFWPSTQDWWIFVHICNIPPISTSHRSDANKLWHDLLSVLIHLLHTHKRDYWFDFVLGLAIIGVIFVVIGIACTGTFTCIRRWFLAKVSFFIVRLRRWRGVWRSIYSLVMLRLGTQCCTGWSSIVHMSLDVFAELGTPTTDGVCSIWIFDIFDSGISRVEFTFDGSCIMATREYSWWNDDGDWGMSMLLVSL